MSPESPSILTRNEKMFRFISSLLVFLVMACVVMTIAMVLQNGSGWHSGVIAGVLLFIVIDRLYTFRQLRSLTPFSSEWALAIGGQWVLIVLILRLLLSYANGLDAFRADLSLFTRGYIAELFTLEFVVTLLLALLVWFLTGRFLDLLEEIGSNPSLALEENPVIQSQVVPAHQRLVSLVFSIGIGLVILTALARVDLEAITANTQGLPRIEFSRLSGGEAGALLYFVFGLGLLSLSRLMSLQTHWNRLRIPVSSGNLTRQWGKYSLLFLLLLAVFVSLLPAGDSFGIFSVLGALLGFLLGVIFFLGQLLISLILLLVSLPFLLFGQGLPNISPPPAPPPLPNLPAQPPAPVTDSAVWAMIRSILLWGSLAAIVFFVFIQFVRQHGGLRAALRESRVMNWLSQAWQWLSRNADKTREGLTRAIADGWQSLVSRLEGNRILPLSNLIRLRALDPRRQIYFFYLAMIRRSEEQGLGRKPSQTPSEYAVTLEKALPTEDKDIESITEAFMAARYSRREINSRDADVVKATWGRIRSALQRKSKESKKPR
ncbi:MAG TPA: DUF4129 domain-containing protein [Anaerolineales bacterium]|nr:DUF4129 domain-containing protein [Anaerolineales bacterium]